MTPLVSVCIPVYNPGPYLRPAVESVLAQDFEDYELIIVDDASDPPATSIALGMDDERIRLYRNSTNLGLVDNWNRCLTLAQGQYVTIFHQDDLMHPRNLSVKVTTLESNAAIGMAYSNIRRIDGEGRVLGGHWIEQPCVDTIIHGCELFAMVARQGNPVSCPSVVLRKACFHTLGTFDRRLAFAVDLEMWMRVASRYDVGYVSEPLIDQRQHSQQETARFAGTGRDYQDVLSALDIAYSSELPAAFAAHRTESYHTLAEQSLAMARWMLRQRRLQPCARYLGVYAKALIRATTKSCAQGFAK